MVESKLEIEKSKFLNETIPEIESKYKVKVLLAYVRGSHMYGTNTPNSDVDISFIYKQPTECILRGDYLPQISMNKSDIVGYEIQRYLELLNISNPNILESLDIPDDCLIYKDESMNVFKAKDWITKSVKLPLLGYAKSQLKKAKGLNKAINNPQPVTRKSPLDFCYVVTEGKSIPLLKYVTDSDVLNKLGATKLSNVRDGYMIYFGNYRGLVTDDSNELRLSSIPKSEVTKGVFMHYNQDGYSSHCKEYAFYWKWVKNRNEDRYLQNKNANAEYDLKNMMHLFRLLKLAESISNGDGLRVRVNEDDLEFLRDIRSGKYSYEELLELSEGYVNRVSTLFEESKLPDNIDKEFSKNVLLKFR